jgi:ribA/ribD-fused uncharacterized protein
METIDSFSGQYAFLSNFYPCEVEFEGDIYPSAEHAYQAAKTTDPDVRRMIRELSSPGKAKRTGKDIRIRPDWKNWRTYYMHQILVAKFNIPELREKLLSTGNSVLIEGNNWNDTYWGICNGRGENHLGRILMEIRNLLGQ